MLREEGVNSYGIKGCMVEDILSDESIDMVVILTLAVTHYELAKKALYAGKHVYTKKTITTAPDTAT